MPEHKKCNICGKRGPVPCQKCLLECLISGGSHEIQENPQRAALVGIAEVPHVAVINHFTNISRPVKTITALLFHVEEETPRFVELPCKTSECPHASNQWVYLEHWMNTTGNLRPLIIDRKNGQKGGYLGRTLYMITNNSVFNPINRCVQRRGAAQTWHGNILVMRNRGRYGLLEDATLADVEPTVKYLMDYGKHADPRVQAYLHRRDGYISFSSA